ncbi:MAG TPA: methyl-accepting chemotaxis protein [Candidatus Competibacteraceae bacterium]|nr:methyl-accepting chemotaxis protein [Candidatus Competibacteraceae bacterium]
MQPDDAIDEGKYPVNGMPVTTDESLLQVVTDILLSLQEILGLKDGKVHDDIHRGKTLISDAVVKLGNSFNSLNTQTHAQQQVVASLIQEVSSDGAGSHDDRVSVREIADSMSAILQGFMDMLAQVSAQSNGVITKMEAMTDVVNQTFSLLSNVEMITKQTNLLSLNAFIEAARSGEAGRGFQVVATEMRNLSQSSAKLNEQIRVQVEKSKKIVHETREVVNEMAMRDMNSLKEAQDDSDMLFAKLAVMNEHISNNLSQVSEITRSIDHSVGLAVQSLQFEDIVGQLLTHAGRELSEQDNMLVELRNHLENFTKVMQNGGDSRAALLKLNDHLYKIRQSAVFQKNKPVLQQSMDEGDVELF